MSKRKNRLAEQFNSKRQNIQITNKINNDIENKKDMSGRIGTGTDGKIKLLYHGDSPRVNTGFGVASREILARLYMTGDYELYCLGINDRGDTSNLFEGPGITHFALPDLRSDPYGIGRFPEVLKQVKPDVIFTLNDIWVLEGSERNGTKNWFLKLLKNKAPFTPWVLYFPVDSRPWTTEWTNLAYSADKTIVYSKYAIDVLQEIYPEKTPIFIPHGVSSKRFGLIKDEDRFKMRSVIGVDKDTFLVGFVSRNQPRKNPAAVIEIFKMANEGYRKCNECERVRNLDDHKCEYCGSSNDNAVEFPAPLKGKARLYMHCQMADPMGPNLYKVAADNNLGDSLIFRPNHHIAYGVPENEFTAILNSLDVHFLPTMAEGFGLCCHPQTLLSSDSGTKMIKDIEKDGKVLSHNGKYHNVLATASRDIDEELYVIKTKYRDELKITSKHPVLILKENMFKWVKAEELLDTDYLVYPKVSGNKSLPKEIDLLDYSDDIKNIEYNNTHIWNKMGYSPKNTEWSYSICEERYGVPKHIIEVARKRIKNNDIEKDVRGEKYNQWYSTATTMLESGFENPGPVKINRFINIDDEFLEFIGWYIAEGSTSNGRNGITIDLHKSEKDIADKLGNYIKRVFGCDYRSFAKDGNRWCLSISNDILARLMNELCGHGSHNKKIPDIFIGCEKSLAPLVSAYIKGDGYINKNNTVTFSTVSRNLQYQITNILSSFNILCSINSLVRENGKVYYVGRIVSQHLNKAKEILNIDIDFRRSNTRQHKCNFMETHQYFILPVESISKEKYTGKVYDIQVEDSNSFVANGLVVHNSILECMKCGVPNIATRTTAVTEQLEDGRGYLIDPTYHMIFDDAANTRKHIIDAEKTLKAFKEVFEDWEQRGEERWGPNTKDMVMKGLEYSKENDWDKMASMFNDEIKDSINSRIKFLDLFSDRKPDMHDQLQPRIFVTKNGSAGEILQTIPAINKMKENLGDEVEIIYAIPSNLIGVFTEEKIPSVKQFVPFDKLSSQSDKKRPGEITYITLDGIEERYEQGSYPYLDRSPVELYMLHLKQGIDENSVLTGSYKLTDEELEIGKQLFMEAIPDYNEETDFVVGISDVAESIRCSWGSGSENWDKLEKYLKAIGLQSKDNFNLKTYRIRTDKRLMENLGAFSMCNVVISPEGSVLDFLYALDIPSVGIVSPYREGYRYKGYDRCHKTWNKSIPIGHVIENPNPMSASQFINDMGTGDVISLILIAYKSWKKSRETVNAKN